MQLMVVVCLQGGVRFVSASASSSRQASKQLGERLRQGQGERGESTVGCSRVVSAEKERGSLAGQQRARHVRVWGNACERAEH